VAFVVLASLIRWSLMAGRCFVHSWATTFPPFNTYVFPAFNPKSKLPVRKRNRQYGGHDAEIAAMAPGADAAAALSHFGTVFGSPPGVPGGGMTGIAPPSRGGAAIFGSTPEGGQMTPFD
jgi:hypothetical protein